MDRFTWWLRFHRKQAAFTAAGALAFVAIMASLVVELAATGATAGSLPVTIRPNTTETTAIPASVSPPSYPASTTVLKPGAPATPTSVASVPPTLSDARFSQAVNDPCAFIDFPAVGDRFGLRLGRDNTTKSPSVGSSCETDYTGRTDEAVTVRLTVEPIPIPTETKLEEYLKYDLLRQGTPLPPGPWREGLYLDQGRVGSGLIWVDQAVVHVDIVEFSPQVAIEPLVDALLSTFARNLSHG